MQKKLTLVTPYLLVMYYPDNTEIYRKEDEIVSVLEGGEIIISSLKEVSKNRNEPFQEHLNGFANTLIIKQLKTDKFEKIIKNLEEKVKGKVRVELKINGNAIIKK